MEDRPQTPSVDSRPIARPDLDHRNQQVEDLAARTRELDVIQTLGRRAAAATDPVELFRSVLAVLEERLPLDLVAVVHELEGEPEVRVYLGRPHSDDYLERLETYGFRLIGWEENRRVGRRVTTLDDFDANAGQRDGWLESDLVTLPVLCRAIPRAYVLVHPGREIAESQIRLLFAAGNQLSLQLERILKAREAEADRFRATLESMPQAVWLVDRQLRPVQSNAAAEQLLEEMGASTLGPFLERCELRGEIAAVIDGRAPKLELEVSPDGNRLFNVTANTVREGSDRQALVLVLNEVTDQRRLQQQLSQSEKMSSLGQMISGVAHELNNPLATILGSAQLLQSAKIEDRHKKRLGVLQEEAQRCRKIVANLLSFARKRDPQIERFSMNETIHSVVALIGYPFKAENVQIETDLDPSISACRGDSDQWRQVFVNLFNNARQAMESQRGGKIYVKTSATDNGSVQIDVIDEGPGISEAMRLKVFDPFFTTKPEGKGTGLGLSIVFGIVEEHGGSIAVIPESAGAHFRMVLPTTATSIKSQTEAPPSPLRAAIARASKTPVPAKQSHAAAEELPVAEKRAPAADQQDPADSESTHGDQESDAPDAAAASAHLDFAVSAEAALEGTAEPAPSPAVAESSRPTLKRILVIDDEQPFARLICDALEEEGHRAEPVFSGEEGLERMRTQTYDFVMCDVRMPGIGAEGVVKAVQDELPQYLPRLIVATGDTIGSGAEQFRESGLRLLQKPFDLEDLLQIVAATSSREE